MRGYASYARAQATRAYMNRVRVQFKEAIVNKLSHGLSDCHIEALLLFHAGLVVNPHVLEELRLKGLIKDEGRGGKTERVS